MADDPQVGIRADFDPSEIGAIAHLYRGEVYRSTIWRTRLDSTTTWAVVTTGIALSATFSSRDAAPLPLTDIIELYDRAAIGPIPGKVVIAAGILFHASWVTLALWTLSRDRHRRTTDIG